ncbi:pilin [Acinetobacter sp. YH12098]|uniref:pilin n=1 Tax=Acinetobacter sp. YH12098 TaxID=2601087 RepID=UPI00359F7CD6
MLAAISIPIYQSYAIKAQIINIISHMDTYRTFTNYTYSQQGKCPSQAEISSIYKNESANSYIESVALTIPDNNTCTLAFKLKNNLSYKISEKTIILNLNIATNDTSNWICTSPDIDKAYLPQDCK